MRVVDSGIVNASFELFEWAEVKAYLHLRTDTEETTIMMQLRAAIEMIERRTNLTLVRRSFTIYFNGDEMENCTGGQIIPRFPVDISTHPTLNYLSAHSTGGLSTWSTYLDFKILESSPHRISLLEDASLPDVQLDEDAWRLTNIFCGYGDGECPEQLKMAVLMQLDSTFISNIDNERLINNAVRNFGLHGNSF